MFQIGKKYFFELLLIYGQFDRKFFSVSIVVRMRRKTMEIGDEVEAKGEYIDRKHSNVRKNSWYRAKILGKKRNTYQIQYNGIESIKTLPESAIRAIPTFSPGKQKIKEGDMIEAKWKIDIDKYVESWWEGKIIGIKKVNRGNTYQILYTNPQHRGTYPNMLEDLVRKVDSAHEAQSGMQWLGLNNFN